MKQQVYYFLSDQWYVGEALEELMTAQIMQNIQGGCQTDLSLRPVGGESTTYTPNSLYTR